LSLDALSIIGYFVYFHEKIGFAERAKNFNWIQIRKVILLNYQNNYVKRSN